MWKQIRLELASTAEFPGGSVSRAFVLRLPITDDGYVDLEEYREHPRKAVVRRHWSSEPDRCGQLLLAGDSWLIRYDGNAESCLELNGKRLHLGQQVPLKLRGGDVLPLRISSIG